jgi:hypothetical protein
MTRRLGLIGGTLLSFFPFFEPNANAFSATFLLFAVESTGDLARFFLVTIPTFIDSADDDWLGWFGDSFKLGKGMGDGNGMTGGNDTPFAATEDVAAAAAAAAASAAAADMAGGTCVDWYSRQFG